MDYHDQSIAQKECNAFTSSSDVFAKIGQAIFPILIFVEQLNEMLLYLTEP